MTEKETNQLLSMIVEVYPAFRKDRDPKFTAKLWQTLFQKVVFEDAKKALLIFIATDTKGFAPVPGKLLEIMHWQDCPLFVIGDDSNDLPMIEELERALINFPGTVIFSEDDRAFLQAVANRIIDITPNGTVDRISTYEDFLINETVKQQIHEKYHYMP